MTDLAWASAETIAAAVAGGETSATTVIEWALARIAQRNPALNAFTAITAERARSRAASIDAARAAGKPVGPLAGVPFAVKNLIDIAGLPTLAGSKINRGHPPATSDATLVSRLEAAGAVLVGALNMAWLRHQWFDPRAVVILRYFRPEADLRPVVACRQLPIRHEPRPSWSVRAWHHRSCARLRCNGGTGLA